MPAWEVVTSQRRRSLSPSVDSLPWRRRARWRLGVRPRVSPRAAIAAGLAFLTAAQPAGQYNPNLGLLREAPTAAPCKYWLFNDNALAGHLLARLRHPLAGTILATLATYERERNGLHEVLWGERLGDSLDWCPRTHYYETFPANRTSIPAPLPAPTRAHPCWPTKCAWACRCWIGKSTPTWRCTAP